jgi:ATP-dependent Clp protease protease subunit
VLSGEVNDVSASLIVAQLLFLESDDPDKDISLYINSPGGHIHSGFAIYDTMNHIKCDVSTICVGMAASMGAFLLTGGTKGKRLALPNSEILIHQPSGGTQGQASDMYIHTEHIMQVKQKFLKIMAENTGQPYEVVERDHERDHYLTAEEALEYGIIDKVIVQRPVPDEKNDKPDEIKPAVSDDNHTEGQETRQDESRPENNNGETGGY